MIHQWLDTLLELYICFILTMEYFWGRSDSDIKHEEKRKRAAKKERILYEKEMD